MNWKRQYEATESERRFNEGIGNSFRSAIVDWLCDVEDRCSSFQIVTDAGGKILEVRKLFPPELEKSRNEMLELLKTL